MKLLLAGSTGLVGRHLLQQALADARVDAVVASVRRAMARQAKLLAPVVDYESLPADAEWWRVDAALCTLGTTMRRAGSREAFRRVDHDYVIELATRVRRHGCAVFVLNSAIGADPGSRFFYNRVKGEVERDLAALGFRSLVLVRPGLIGGEREESRPGERFALHALHLAAPLLPRRWRINPAGHIARAMLEAALAPPQGIHIIDAASLAGDG